MQREIKFRAWDGLQLIELKTLHMDLQHLSMPVMQFTGLKDKNGKEIFEGDIVRSAGREIGVIDFSEGAFVLGVHKEGELHHEEIATEEDAWEVLGNIYENPELLK